MMNLKFVRQLVLLLLAASPLASFSAPAPIGLARAPSLLGVGCSAVVYEPVPVFDSPGGVRIGKLVLDEPALVAKERKSCPYQPKLQFLPESQTVGWDVKVEARGTLEQAIAVYKVVDHARSLWLLGQSNVGSFWLPVARGVSYESYEVDLVQGLDLFSEQCEPDGRCTPVHPELQKKILRAGQERQDPCNPQAYDIEGVTVLQGGRKAYRVRLAEPLLARYADSLPVTALVPIKDFRGEWTGYFNPARCSLPQ